jgi:subtilase family serine protease
MFQTRRIYAIFLFAIVLLVASSATLVSQTIVTGRRAQALIREKVDETKRITLAGNTHPEASAENDRGAVSDDLNLDHMMLQLKRSAQQEEAAEQFIAELHDPHSANFHKWTSATAFGENYGLAEADLKTITGWLESHGFVVNSVYPNGLLIDFSGSAGQVRAAFHTSIHNLNVKGVHHIANISDPQIPEALAPAVTGVVSMHDFRPHKMSLPKYTIASNRQTAEALVPADLATIYDFNPLFSKGTTGAGQTVVVIEDTDVFSRADWVTFRSTFGLSQYTSGSLTSQHPATPSGVNNCVPPGVNSDDVEAILDAEWASAAAPGASIVVAACGDTTSPTAGLMFAMQNLVNSSNPPPVMSLSYGICEAYNGAALNASINLLYQQAAAEGVSVFAAAGDDGAANCDSGAAMATHGISVSGFASTPYNVAVGGTDFSDVVNGTTATYWSRTNSATYGSALSYIPEIPWNNSCASPLIANYLGYSTGYGPNGFCNSNAALTGGLVTVSAGSGGPSNCATGAPATAGVASGTCQGYPKPSWQTGLAGIPSDGVRDLPDVALFSSNNPVWGHYSIICYSDQENGGTPCTGSPSNWIGVGGTSLAAPVMAGIQALVDQSVGARQGNPNPVYYALAASTPSAFHPITQGDIDVVCAAPYNCYGYVGNLDYGRNGRIFDTTWAGALSVSNTSLSPAYAAGGSWNFATGIGSVDVNNLVTNWGKQ